MLPAFDDHWDADDEASLIQTYWQGTPPEYMTSGPDFISHPKMVLVFKAALHVFKIDPVNYSLDLCRGKENTSQNMTR